MARTGWQRKRVRFLTTLLSLCVMAMIFGFSMQNADQSDRTSGFISNRIIMALYREYDSETPERQQEIYDSVQHIVRKIAHFSEYTLLGFALRLCVESWFGRRIRKKNRGMLPAGITGMIYAGTDEWHQNLTDGRSGQWTDVILDCCGVLCGIYLGNRLIIMTERKAKEEQRGGDEHRSGESGDSAEHREHRKDLRRNGSGSSSDPAAGL